MICRARLAAALLGLSADEVDEDCVEGAEESLGDDGGTAEAWALEKEVRKARTLAEFWEKMRALQNEPYLWCCCGSLRFFSRWCFKV